MDTSSNQEKRTKRFRRELEGWREVLVAGHSLLNWDKPFYPVITASVTSLVFLLIWYLDPSLLTLLSLIGLLATLLDYIVPQVSSMFVGGHSWTGEQERRYEQVVEWMAYVAGGCSCSMARRANFKAHRPKLYFLILSTSFMVMAYLGSSLNNLFMTYCLVLFMLLLPGLQKQSIAKQYFAVLMSCFASLVGRKQVSPAPQDKKKD